MIAWLAAAFTVPIVPYAWSTFPEIAAAAIVAWTAVWAIRDPRSSPVWSWAARGLALSLLPWLHTKFVILEAPLGLMLMWRLRPDVKSLLALALPIVVSALAWFAFFWVVYGTPNPEAPYGNFAREWVKAAFVPRGLLGLLIDQKFGLITYAPVYLLALVGLAVTLRHGAARAVTLSAAILATAFAISCARLYMWWGGWSAPARFLVPAVPLLVPALAIGIEYLRYRKHGWIITVLLPLSLTISLVSAALPQRLLLFSEAHGVSRLAEAVQGSAPLTATLPMFTESQWQPGDLVPRRYRPAERMASVVRGRLELLERFTETRRAFHYPQRRWMRPQQWRAAGTITADVARADGPAPLPARGIYAEGESFWTMGRRRALVLVPPLGRRRIDATIHVGPSGGVCHTTINGGGSRPRRAPVMARS